jgi:hypothetical protein
MNYSDIRSQIQSGDVIAWCRNHKPAGKIISIATNSPYTHVGTAWVVGERVLVFEAVVPLVRIFPLSKLLPFEIVHMGRDLSDYALTFAMSKVGEKYSLLECARGYLNRIIDDDRWQCAEYTKSIQIANGWNFICPETPVAVMNEAKRYSGNEPIVILS